MQFKYRKVDHPRYIYAMDESYMIDLPEFNGIIEDRKTYEADFFWSSLRCVDGAYLWIKKNYHWNGASGPAINTENWVRGSCVHDSLYQISQDNKFSGKFFRQYRKAADKVMLRLLLEDGMPKIRAYWSYCGVRVFGAKHARGNNEK